MGIEFSDGTIERWIREGLQNALNSMMRDSYGQGAKLKSAMDKAIAESEQQIVEALKVGISQACVSPEFLRRIEADVAQALASQYRGSFDAVIKAAAKQAANDAIVAARVAEMTRKAAGLESEKGGAL